jgi:nicotinamidase-related amidase
VNKVIDLRVFTGSRVLPTLVFVDLQQEYLATQRALAVPDAELAIQNCRVALAHARAVGMPVAFVRMVGQSAFFNPATRFSRPIEGFEPESADLVFERNKPSCYDNDSFAEVMEHAGGNFILAGLAGEAACLATAVDAFHRGHRFTFLADASASHALNEMSAGEVHRAVKNVIGLYGDVELTGDWVAGFRSQAAWNGDHHERRNYR